MVLNIIQFFKLSFLFRVREKKVIEPLLQLKKNFLLW